MIDIRLGINDFGTPHIIHLYPEDGKGFTQAELAVSTFLFRIYKRDYLRLPCRSDNDRIYTSNTNKLHHYEDGQSLIIGNEVMTVDGDPSIDGKYIKVARVEPVFHPKQSLVSHIYYESSTVVSWDPTSKILYLTPEADMVKYPGSYQFLIQVDTGTRKSTIKNYSKNVPYIITFVSEV